MQVNFKYAIELAYKARNIIICILVMVEKILIKINTFNLMKNFGNLTPKYRCCYTDNII